MPSVAGRLVKKLERTEIAQVGATPFLLESPSTKLDPNLQSLPSDSAGGWEESNGLGAPVGTHRRDRQSGATVEEQNIWLPRIASSELKLRAD